MPTVVSLEGFTPPPRYDAVPWTTARIEESTTSATGPWSTAGTSTLSPVDSNPANPQVRNFTVIVATPTGWYRVVWIDASANEADSAAIYSDQTSYQSSGINFAALVASLKSLTAISDTEAKARLNQAHRELVADAEALKARIAIGTTTAGEDTYELDPDIVQLLSLRVGGKRYDRKSIEDLDDLANDPMAYTVGYPARFFAPEYSAIGGGEVAIWPIPTTGGLAITARAAMLPPDLVNDSDFPSLPADFHQYLVDPGAFAVVLSRDDERFSDSQAKQQEWEAVKSKLRGRLNKRVGSGIARIQIVR